MSLYDQYEVVIDANGVEKRESYTDIHRALMAFEHHKLQPRTFSVDVYDFDAEKPFKPIAHWARSTDT